MGAVQIFMYTSSNKKYVVTGIVLTAIYFGILLGLSYPADLLKFLRTANFNEIGDFLAGVFSPVAFLWLVVGYFMQSQELRMQREAFIFQTQLTQNELELQRRSADPHFDLAQIDPTDGRSFGIENKNNQIARQVIVYHIDHRQKNSEIITIVNQLPEGGQSTFNIRESLTLPDRCGEQAELQVIYNTKLDDLRCQRFGLTLADQGKLIGWQLESANDITAYPKQGY